MEKFDLKTALQHVCNSKAYRELIGLIPNSKEWRECATSVLISLIEERKYIRWLLAANLSLNVAVLTFLVKIVFFG